MIKCPKCDIEVNTLGTSCPLCNTKLEKNKNNIYPSIKKEVSYSLVRRIVLLIVIISCITVGVINYVFTPKITWSAFVIIQLLILYRIVNSLLQGKTRILTMIFGCFLLINAVSIFWDYYTGFYGWSINYVLPSMSISYGIFIFIFRMIKHITFHSNSNFIYINLLVGFIPVILLFFNRIEFPILSILSGIVALINILFIAIFDWHNFKNDIEKNLYI